MAAGGSHLSPSLLVSTRFPAELVILIIEHLPFEDGKNIAALRGTHSRFKTILRNYECSITRTIVGKEIRHAPVDFPTTELYTLGWLVRCVRRYDILDDIMDALSSHLNYAAVKKHNLSLVNTGLLLLERFSLAKNHEAKLIHLKSLGHDTLTAIYLTIHHSTLSARYHSSEWINQRNYRELMDAQQLPLHRNLEFAFAEAALSIGAEFISNTLLRWDSSDAEVVFLNFYHYQNTDTWHWVDREDGNRELQLLKVQGPHQEPGNQSRSLFETMLERMAQLADCSLEDVRSKVEQQTDAEEHLLAYLDIKGKEKLFQEFNLGSKYD